MDLMDVDILTLALNLERRQTNSLELLLPGTDNGVKYVALDR